MLATLVRILYSYMSYTVLEQPKEAHSEQESESQAEQIDEVEVSFSANNLFVQQLRVDDAATIDSVARNRRFLDSKGH